MTFSWKIKSKPDSPNRTILAEEAEEAVYAEPEYRQIRRPYWTQTKVISLATGEALDFAVLHSAGVAGVVELGDGHDWAVAEGPAHALRVGETDRAKELKEGEGAVEVRMIEWVSVDLAEVEAHYKDGQLGMLSPFHDSHLLPCGGGAGGAGGPLLGGPPGGGGGGGGGGATLDLGPPGGGGGAPGGFGGPRVCEGTGGAFVKEGVEGVAAAYFSPD